MKKNAHIRRKIKMEVKNDFVVKEVEGKVIVEQTMTKTMELNEATMELQKLRNEMLQVKQQKDKLETYINTEQYKKELEKTLENSEQLDKLEKDWQAIIAPALETSRKELKSKVKGMKAAAGYDRISDGNKKVVTKNTILTDAIKEMKLDPQHPAVQEVRREFDKI